MQASGITLSSLCLHNKHLTDWAISPALAYLYYRWFLVPSHLAIVYLCQCQCHLIRKSPLMLPPDKWVLNLPHYLQTNIKALRQGLVTVWLQWHWPFGDKAEICNYRGNKLRTHCGPDSQRGTHGADQRIKKKQQGKKMGFLPRLSRSQETCL